MNLDDREYKASTSVLEIKILNLIEKKIRSMETKSQTANTSVLEKNKYYTLSKEKEKDRNPEPRTETG